MPRSLGEATITEEAAGEFRAAALREARKIMSDQENVLRKKKEAAQTLYQTALEIAERELKREVPGDAD